MAGHRIAAVAVGLAMALGACSSTDPDAATEQFQVQLPPPAGVDLEFDPLPVIVRAPAGLVDGVAEGDLAAIGDLGPETGVFAIPDRPDAVTLGWLGGACDERVEITIEPTGAGLRISSRVQDALVAACPAIGIMRAIEVDVAIPIDIANVELEQRAP